MKNDNNQKNDVIKIHVGTKSVNESNDFLRKLWGLLDKEYKNAWAFFPFTNTSKRVVEFGSNNIGTFSFDYQVKGHINNLYIKDYKIEKGKLIDIVEKAISSENIEEYYVKLHYTQKDDSFRMARQCRENVLVFSEGPECIVCFRMSAFSKLDFEFWLHQKAIAIQQVLFLYTKNRFSIQKKEYAYSGSFSETELYEYNYEWFDDNEYPKNEANECCLPQDFFKVVNSISSQSFYDDFISAVVNASQMLNNAAGLFLLFISHPELEMERTGIFDMINANIVSSLEAILSAKPIQSEICKKCGQPVYSISKRVHDLVYHYMGNYIADSVKKKTYKNRSKYLHEGKSVTPLYRYKSCYPLIDPRNPREILNAETPIEYNLIDYCMYIVRKYISDYYSEK